MRMRNQKICSLLFAAAFVAVVSTAVSALAGPPAAPAAKVVVGKVVEREVAQNQSMLGVLAYDRVSEVSTEVAGLVKKIRVKEGDKVAKGDVLVVLNTEILDQEIALMRTRIAQDELRINNVGKNFARLKKLYAQASVSEKVFDDAQFTYQNAEKEKQANENKLQKLLIQKRRSVIRAPFTGVILDKGVESGAWVQQGRILVRLGASEEVYVRVPISETILQYVKIGDHVPVRLNAFGRDVAGEVAAIDPVADVKTKNVFVKIKIAPPDRMVENMSANVAIAVGAKQMLKIVPRVAVVNLRGKDFVYTIKDEKAVPLPVHIVAFLGDEVAVSSPALAAGMAVVIEGNERLRPDQAVVVAGER